MKVKLTPPSEWPINSIYVQTWVCYHNDRNGAMDPTIRERIMLADEYPEYAAEIRENNPNATVVIARRKHWRGGHRFYYEE